MNCGSLDRAQHQGRICGPRNRRILIGNRLVRPFVAYCTIHLLAYRYTMRNKKFKSFTGRSNGEVMEQKHRLVGLGATLSLFETRGVERCPEGPAAEIHLVIGAEF